MISEMCDLRDMPVWTQCPILTCRCSWGEKSQVKVWEYGLDEQGRGRETGKGGAGTEAGKGTEGEGGGRT